MVSEDSACYPNQFLTYYVTFSLIDFNYRSPGKDISKINLYLKNFCKDSYFHAAKTQRATFALDVLET